MADSLTKPLATYSHCRRVGELVFIAGQGCRDPETNDYAGLEFSKTGDLLRYDIAAQTRGVLKNIERVLQNEGLNRNHIIDVNVFLKDMKDFPGMNEVWNEFFAKAPLPPTRTTVCVKDLPGQNFVEMKSIASTQRIGP